MEGPRDINVVVVTQEWDHGGRLLLLLRSWFYRKHYSTDLLSVHYTQHMWVPLVSLCSIFWGLASASGVKNLVVFGDSYADVGNLQRLSNGPFWSEDLAVGWNASLYSFAFDGAVCDNALFNDTSDDDALPSIVDQIEMYYNQQLNLEPSETVYAFWVGLNDIERGFQSKGTEFPWGDIISCISHQMRNIRKVFSSNRFLVLNVPPVELMPYFAGSDMEDTRSNIVSKFNELLSKDVVSLNKHHRALEMDLVDVNALISDMVGNPEDFGFKNATSAYWDVCQGQCTDDMDTYVWWDSIHLTGGAHRAIANSILLSGSLEPPVSLPSSDQVEQALSSNDLHRSPKYSPEKSTGTIEKVVKEIMAAKETEEPTPEVEEQVEEDSSFSHIYFVIMVSVILCIGFVWFTRRQKRAGGLAALSSLVKTNTGRGRFMPLRNLESSNV
ncbi:hypothetical protein O0I10_000115 [Lichtheimia ornata]|uniref:Carbohydrate esterase family 16 protein n=1 Tax=Lichtheimia ornata TaxID=688661 RepID=A0AAD8DJ87_9FUNG|nr:uncharacterized protein O0I10_000115 [Lichtheimia ornata]KAJ8663841.1 hypothetical protein O0I10_000115 [Lichtheimia ornata]